ncbi:hypothetical protein R0137_13930 [Congregibacter brevis]|uniref:Uncharacterized protein n=1 Tax=Congregibacter brevis TaxID=3081201 RepID=A0ABZ0IA03_9GAMM|nr:hypothetical protein R0137_13930 [Congregibacter sp. IMCC45268]
MPALLYAVFFYWYTDFSGPLSDTEIDQFVATMKANGSDPEVIAFIERFARQDSGRQILMVNNIDMNDNPPDVEGAEPGESGSDLMGRYMEYMMPALLTRASHPVFMGSAVYPAMDLVGIEGAENWDQAALFRYRSRRALLEIVANPAFSGKHHFKTAALDKTIAYPTEIQLYLGDPRLLLGLILVAVTALIDNFRISRRAS